MRALLGPKTAYFTVPVVWLGALGSVYSTNWGAREGEEGERREGEPGGGGGGGRTPGRVPICTRTNQAGRATDRVANRRGGWDGIFH